MNREATIAKLNRRLHLRGRRHVDLVVYRTRRGRYGVEINEHRAFKAPIILDEINFESFPEARGWAAGYLAAALAADMDE